MRYLEIVLDSSAAPLLADLRQLRSLDIWCQGHERECRAAVAQLTQLEHLALSMDFGGGLEFVGGLTDLKSLEIFGDHAGQCMRLFPVLGKLTRLERLSIGQMKLGSDDLAQLECLKNLKSLTICDYDAEHDDCEEVAREYFVGVGKLSQLERLYLCQLKVHGDDLAHLRTMTNLKSLMLEDMNVGDEDVRHLAVLPRLKLLELSKTLVRGAGLAGLAPLESLEELEIDGEAATESGLEALLALKRLKALHLTGAPYYSLRLAPNDADEVFVGLPRGLLRGAEGPRRALRALRQANPQIAIDAGSGFNDSNESAEWREAHFELPEREWYEDYDKQVDRSLDSFLRRSLPYDRPSPP